MLLPLLFAIAIDVSLENAKEGFDDRNFVCG